VRGRYRGELGLGPLSSPWSTWLRAASAPRVRRLFVLPERARTGSRPTPVRFSLLCRGHPRRSVAQRASPR